VLRDLYRLGLRSAQLSAHNCTNNFADSCCSPPKWHGLNERGWAVMREMNRLGMVINVSHSSDETISQAMDVSTDPSGFGGLLRRADDPVPDPVRVSGAGTRAPAHRALRSHRTSYGRVDQAREIEALVQTLVSGQAVPGSAIATTCGHETVSPFPCLYFVSSAERAIHAS
jgi:hypothetical protein